MKAPKIIDSYIYCPFNGTSYNSTKKMGNKSVLSKMDYLEGLLYFKIKELNTETNKSFYIDFQNQYDIPYQIALINIAIDNDLFKGKNVAIGSMKDCQDVIVCIYDKDELEFFISSGNLALLNSIVTRLSKGELDSMITYLRNKAKPLAKNWESTYKTKW